ncbi:hypothetical protein WR25_21673 [Diploscapter pachys]|uniref:Oligomycin sensitivity conferral protein n=1 Tax=Diploscapter pachys TaxID=2018661 RepID=A0A2A2LBR9_9BILA|nr:hypothetical protein WR25_21673 [Diploscapter pachys]
MASHLIKRSFSVSTISHAGQVVKVPIQVHGIEGRYASALYTAAHRNNKLDQVEKDLKNVRDVYQSNAKFKDFVLDPTLKAVKKKAAVDAIGSKLGLAKESVNFLGVLAENGRLNKLESVVSSFESIMRAHRGELFVQITSAESLSNSHQQQISEALGKLTKSGQKLTITYAVKPSIVGGLVVTIGDKYVDLSIASRIKKYTDVLQTAV